MTLYLTDGINGETDGPFTCEPASLLDAACTNRINDLARRSA
jgi:hypothetical protein